MRLPRRGGKAAAAVLTATALMAGRPPLRAQDAPPAPRAVDPAMDAALTTTRTRGVATVAVFTAPERPASARFWAEFNEGAWARANRGLVQLVNVPKERNADLVRALGITRFPTVVIFGRGPGGVGVAKLGTITDCETPEGLAQWLRALDPGAARADAAVARTLYGGDVYPSQQVPPPAAQAPPQVQAQPQPQPAPMLMAAPPAVSTTATMIQVPSQNLMIQQAPPQVFLAPQPSPLVYVPQVMNAAPAPAMAPSAPAANLFMMAPAPALAAAPAPQPTLAAAPPTLALAASPAAAPATLAVAASGPQTLAVNNQTLSLASTGTRSRVRVKGPGLLSASLARFGERLTQLGRTRIVSVQETTLEAPAAQAPAAGLTTISTTSAAPVAPPPATVLLQAPPAPPAPPHVCKPPCQHQHQGPPPLRPTPQDASAVGDR